MSINTGTPQDSLIEDSLALQLFTNRYEFIRRFSESLNDEPPPEKICFFAGEGGNGKSLLLKLLWKKYCKRLVPSVWQQIKAMSNDRFATTVEQIKLDDYTPVPAVILDFGQPPIGDDKSQDPFYGLLMLRRNLAMVTAKLGYQLKFPLYDFACIWYLYKKGKSSEDIKRLFPLTEIAGLIASFADFVNQMPFGTVGKAVLDIFAKDLGPKFNLYLQKRAITTTEVEEICQKNLDTELINTLPHWFALDLNAAMREDNVPSRLVLFFDSHEAFWGHQRNLPEYSFFQKDEWLRCLLSSLELSKGIVVVIAGQETPRWAEAPKLPILPKYLESQSIKPLPSTEAKCYLQKAKISDVTLQQALINYASITSEQVHPFYLGLCADVVWAAEQRGTILNSTDFATLPEISTKSRELLSRLLKYANTETEYAIHALSACRHFDFALYSKLGQALHFEATMPAFNILTRFSFVWRDDKPRHNNYRIHNLLRRLYHELGNATTNQAHLILEQHYREQGNVADAIYHAICHDENKQRGANEWLKEHDRANQQGKFELCRILQEIREELNLRLPLDESHNQ